MPIVCAFKKLDLGTLCETVEVLLEYGAKVHEILYEESKRTVFHHSVSYLKNLRLVDTFLQYGASPQVKDKAGNRPVDECRHLEVIHERLSDETSESCLSRVC